MDDGRTAADLGEAGFGLVGHDDRLDAAISLEDVVEADGEVACQAEGVADSLFM